MKRLLLAILLVTSYFSVVAQNWQTIGLKDTVFYRHAFAPNSYRIDSDMLRTMWVDSAKAVAGDSLFFFFRGIRIDTPFGTKCQDTMAPSWLGTHMIRKQDGTEYYFNSQGDTITFRTAAGLGEFWTLTKDVSGKTFQGRVTSLGQRVIDGTTDSVKTISIQAMSGSVAVADPYNSLIFEISKSHGWLNTLDLFRFPNQISGSGYGIMPSPSQQRRLPRPFAYWPAGNTDLAWRYLPGNDFITTHNYGVNNLQNGQDPSPTLGGNEVVTHDSVLAFTQLAPGKAAVTFHTVRFSHIWTFLGSGSPNGFTDTAFTVSYIHTDTIVSDAGTTVQLFPLYESRFGSLPLNMPSGFDRHYYVDSMSDGHFSLEESREAPSSALIRSGNCWKWSAISPDPEARITNWVEGFGQRMSFYYYASPAPIKYDRVEVTYANLPGLTWGKKINVPALGVNRFGNPGADAFAVQPNPANSVIRISSTTYRRPVQATLRNVAGQCVRQGSFSGQLVMATIDLAPGLYFLEVHGNEFRQILKVVVQH